MNSFQNKMLSRIIYIITITYFLFLNFSLWYFCIKKNYWFFFHLNYQMFTHYGYDCTWLLALIHQWKYVVYNFKSSALSIQNLTSLWSWNSSIPLCSAKCSGLENFRDFSFLLCLSHRLLFRKIVKHAPKVRNVCFLYLF